LTLHHQEEGKILEVIKDLSVNMLILFFPVLIYHLFEQRTRSRQKHFIAVASGLSIILCMIFPLELIKNNNLFDLRQIPFILSGLYGGLYPLLSSFTVLIGTRFYLGGEGALGAFWVNAILGGIMVAVIIRYRNKYTTSLQRIVGGGIISLLGSAITILIITFRTHTTPVTELLTHSLFQGAGTLSLLYMIEQLQKNHAIRNQFARQEKTEIVSQLAASISHEVRNPLTVIRGFIQLLRQEYIEPDKRKQYIDIALEELDRAESIISGYLQFAKQDSTETQILNLDEELAAILKLMEPYALNEGVTLTGPSSHCNGYILGDSALLRQCILNIIKNGIEATPPNGNVVVATACLMGKIHLEIIDTGIGMSKEQIRKLGEPYYSTKEKGTGLGMMVTYNGIQNMGGTIHVESQVKQGTKFVITFPTASLSMIEAYEKG
jgi:two-component system sporulation sensor kinase B